MAGLTEKNRQVAQKLLEDPEFSAVQAYRSVYPKASQKSAESAASKLMGRADFQRYLGLLIQQREQKTQITAERVVAELGKIAFSDIRQFAKWKGTQVNFKSSDEIDAEAAAAIRKVSSSYTENGQTLNLELHDKISALRLLAKHVGLLQTLPEAIVSLRRYGIYIRPKEDGTYELIDAMSQGEDISSLDFLSGLVDHDDGDDGD